MRNLAVKERIKFTLRLRLFLFLIILVTTILLGVLIILFVSGNITAGLKESEIFIKNEHSLILKNTTESFDKLAAEAVALSRSLSMSIEGRLKEKNLDYKDLNNNPELLNEVVSSELNQLILYLQMSKRDRKSVV